MENNNVKNLVNMVNNNKMVNNEGDVNMVNVNNLKEMVRANGYVAVTLYSGKAFKGNKVPVSLKGVKAEPTRPETGVYNTFMDEYYTGKDFVISFVADSQISQLVKTHWTSRQYFSLLKEVNAKEEENQLTRQEAATKVAYKAMYNGARKLSILVRTLNESYISLFKQLLTNGVDLEIIEASTLDVFEIKHVADLKKHALRQALSIIVHESQVDKVKNYHARLLNMVEAKAYREARYALALIEAIVRRRAKEDVFTKALSSMRYAAQNVVDAVNNSGVIDLGFKSINEIIGTPAYEKMLIDVRMYGPAYGINVKTYESDFNRTMVKSLKPVAIPRRMEGASKAAIEEYEMHAIKMQLDVEESLKRPSYAGTSNRDFWEYEDYENRHPLSPNEINAYYGQIAKANSLPNIEEVITAYTQIVYFYETDRYGFLESGYGICPHCGCPVRINEAAETTLDSDLHHTEVYHTEVTCQYCDHTSTVAEALGHEEEVAEVREYVLPEVAMDVDAPEYIPVVPTTICKRSSLDGSIINKDQQ